MELNNYELNFTSRYVVELPKEFEIESYFINSAELPKLINGNWQNINIKFVNPIADSMTKKLLKIVNQNTTFNYTIKLLDPLEEITEKWVIKVRKIIGVDFGELNYNNTDILISTLTIEPSSCELINL